MQIIMRIPLRLLVVVCLALLDVRAGAALLPDGVPGESSVTLVLFFDGTPSRVVAESRLGGVARRDLPE